MKLRYLYISIVILFLTLVILFTVKNKLNINKFETYPDTTFNSSGSVENIKKFYVRNYRYYLHEEYFKNGNIKEKGSLFDDKWTGPYYYDSLGNLILYNDVNLNQECFYVKKFKDNKLIKEEGISIYDDLFLVSNPDSGQIQLMFCYSKPPKYKNYLHAFLDNKEINFTDFFEHHIGLISLNKSELTHGKHRIIVVAKLLNENNELIDQSTLYCQFNYPLPVSEQVTLVPHWCKRPLVPCNKRN